MILKPKEPTTTRTIKKKKKKKGRRKGKEKRKEKEKNFSVTSRIEPETLCIKVSELRY